MYTVQIFLAGSLVKTWSGKASNGIQACNLAEKSINPTLKIMYHYQARKKQNENS